MTEKLTPRVGDRVLVKTGAFTGVVTTYAANVLSVDQSGTAHIHVAEVGENGWWDIADLTVVDRELVEWPEGWKVWGDVHVFVREGDDGASLSKPLLEKVVNEGPDMLARWDELMGEQ